MYYNNLNMTKEWGILISIKDYAKKKGVSYEAVRKQVIRYKSELEGHITKINRTQYLNDEAVSFLDTKRQENPVMQNNKESKIFELESKVYQLEEENRELLLKISDLENKLLEAHELISELKNEKITEKDIELNDENDKLQPEELKKSWWKNLFK